MNPASHHLTLMIKVNITNNTYQHHVPLGMYLRSISLCAILPNNQNFMRNHEETLDKSKLRTNLYSIGLMFFKGVRTWKSEGLLQTGEIKETSWNRKRLFMEKVVKSE